MRAACGEVHQGRLRGQVLPAVAVAQGDKRWQWQVTHVLTWGSRALPG